MWVNPDDPFNRAGKSLQQRQLQAAIDRLNRIGKAGTFVGGRIPASKKTSTGGYASGYRPGNYQPAKGTQGGYAKGYTPGRYTPGASKKSDPTKFGPMEAFKNVAEAGMNYADKILADRAAQQAGGFGGGFGGMSFDDVMQQIISSGQLEMPDAEELANKQFQPQYDLLDQLRTQTTGRMNKQAQDAQAMYNSLGQSFEGDKVGVAKQYDTAAQNLDAAFGDAASTIQQTGDNSGAEMRAIMNKLGIQEAAPAAIANIDEDQARSLNSIAELEANYKGLNTASEQGMLDYLTNEANTMGVAGANAKADINSMLEQTLQGYDNEELGIRGQHGATENQYLMQLLGMQQEAQSAAAANAQAMYDSMNEQQQWAAEQDRWRQEFEWDKQTDTWDNEIARAAQERALREMQQNSSGGASGNSQTRDASTLVTAEAARLFDNPQIANAAAKGIRDAFIMGGDIQTVQQLMQAVSKRFPGNQYLNEYLHLASVYGQALGLK